MKGAAAGLLLVVTACTGASPQAVRPDVPAGQCRLWYPERPLNRQPPPGPCRYLRGAVPAGAVLLSGE